MLADTKYHLFIRYNKARWAIKRDNNMPVHHRIHMLTRLNKALGILQHHDYFVAEKEQYQPDRWHCNCADQKYWYSAKRDYRGPCKHRLAIAMLEMKLEYKQLTF